MYFFSDLDEEVSIEKGSNTVKRVLTLLIVLSFCGTNLAQSSEKKTLKVDLSEFDPIVTVGKDGKVKGPDIDIIEHIASELDYECDFRVVSFDRIFNGLQDGSADIAMGGISITRAREEVVDFSQPYIVTGQDIIVLSEQRYGIFSNVIFYVKAFLSSNAPVFIMAFCLIWFVLANIFLIISWKRNDEIPSSYLRGVLHSAAHVLYFMGTQGPTDRNDANTNKFWKDIGVLFNMMICFFGVIIMSVLYGSVSSEFTAMKLKRGIQSKADLEGKRIAVVGDTTSEFSLQDMNVNLIKVSDLKEAYLELFQNNADAVVADSIPLQYYSRNKGLGKVRLVNNVFNQDFYGIAVAEGNPLIEDINRVLLQMIRSNDEENVYDNILERWDIQGMQQN